MKTGTLSVAVMLAAGWLVSATAAAETWHLNPQAGWQAIDDTPEGRYLLTVSQLRQTLAAGDQKDVLAALESLKTDYPELAGGDLDAFIAAETIYAKGNLGKAGKLYKVFLETWPDSPLQPVAMERYFSIGAAFLQGQKRVFLKVLRLPAFDDGVTIMHTIADKAGNTPISLRALTTLAENQERRKKYIDAYHSWAEIASRWPTGEAGQNALLRMARALHTSYNGPDYDASAIQSAKSYFEDYRLRYPQMAEQLNIDQTLALIEEQLAYKVYQVGYYYERAENTHGADNYYAQVKTGWPQSSAAQMAALRAEPDATPAIKPTLRRKAFNGVGMFLDNWFGVQWLLPKKETEQAS